MKTIITTVAFLFLVNFVNGQENEISVDFSKAVYYPLLKNKASIFLEGLPHYGALGHKTYFEGDSLSLTDLMKPIQDLQIGYFRALVRQDIPSNKVYEENGEIKVRKTDATEEFIQQCYANQIIPGITLFRTPLPYRQIINGEMSKSNDPPSDMDDYARTMGKYSQLFSGKAPLMIEVWNEPDLNIFLNVDNHEEVYNLMYTEVAPEIRNADPDFLVAGPGAASVQGEVEVFCNAFMSNVEKHKLPLDVYTIHSYGRHKESYSNNPRISKDHTDYTVKVARNSLGEAYQTVPIVFTEYEYYPAGAKHDLLHYNREYTIGAVKFLGDLKYFISQTDVQAVTWNRYVNRGKNYRKGGLIDHYNNRRPIYYAYQFYGQMPVERKSFLSGNTNSKVDGFASANNNQAAVMFWNDSEESENIKLSMHNIPNQIKGNGYMAIYRVDKNNASYIENGLEECFPVLVEKVTDNSKTIDIEIPGPGIVYVKFEEDVTKKGVKNTKPQAKFIRNWQWCAREKIGEETLVTGDYGNFDWKNWTANIGVKNKLGRGISGVTLDKTPSQMVCEFKTFQVDKAPSDNNALVGLRIDYCIDGEYNNTVLLCGNLFNSARNTELPWGAKGASADKIIKEPKMGSGEKFKIDFDKYAPGEWLHSKKRRIILSFWMENSGTGSQGTVKLFGVQ